MHHEITSTFSLGVYFWLYTDHCSISFTILFLHVIIFFHINHIIYTSLFPNILFFKHHYLLFFSQYDIFMCRYFSYMTFLCVIIFHTILFLILRYFSRTILFLSIIIFTHYSTMNYYIYALLLLLQVIIFMHYYF